MRLDDQRDLNLKVKHECPSFRTDQPTVLSRKPSWSPSPWILRQLELQGPPRNFLLQPLHFKEDESRVRSSQGTPTHTFSLLTSYQPVRGRKTVQPRLHSFAAGYCLVLSATMESRSLYSTSLFIEPLPGCELPEDSVAWRPLTSKPLPPARWPAWSLHLASCWPFTPPHVCMHKPSNHIYNHWAWSPPVHDTSHITSVDMPSEKGECKLVEESLQPTGGKAPQVSAPFPLLWTS